MRDHPISPSTHILHVILVVHGILFVAIDTQEELAGDVNHLAVAVLVLGGQNGHGADAERVVHGGQLEQLGQVQGAAVVQGLCPAVQRGPTDRARLGVIGVIVCAAFPLPREQGLSFSRLVLLLEARGSAQAVPARASASPVAAGAPVGAGGTAEAGLREEKDI